MQNSEMIRLIEVTVQEFGDFHPNELGYEIRFVDADGQHHKIVSVDFNWVYTEVKDETETLFLDCELNKLDNDTLRQVLEAAEQWEIECLKTEKRCQG